MALSTLREKRITRSGRPIRDKDFANSLVIFIALILGLLFVALINFPGYMIGISPFTKPTPARPLAEQTYTQRANPIALPLERAPTGRGSETPSNVFP